MEEIVLKWRFKQNVRRVDEVGGEVEGGKMEGGSNDEEGLRQVDEGDGVSGKKQVMSEGISENDVRLLLMDICKVGMELLK